MFPTKEFPLRSETSSSRGDRGEETTLTVTCNKACSYRGRYSVDPLSGIRLNPIPKQVFSNGRNFFKLLVVALFIPSMSTGYLHIIRVLKRLILFEFSSKKVNIIRVLKRLILFKNF